MQLRPFQQEDVGHVEAAGFRALIANAPGTGKTSEALSCLNRGHETLLPALVVCPASVVTNWQREARMWTPWMKTTVIEGESGPIRAGRHLYICSWAILAARQDQFAAMNFRTIIADECHFVLHEESQRSQALSYLIEKATGRLLLSGTPIIADERDLQTLYRYLGTEKPLLIRRLIEDVAPEIPLKTRAYIPVSLPPKSLAEYQKAEADFAEWLGNEIQRKVEEIGGDPDEAEGIAEQALAAEALVKIGYLRRILAAGKVSAAVDWTARAVRLGEPVLIFAEHKLVIEKLCRGLRKARVRYVCIDGSASRRERQLAIDAFQAGEIPVFIGSKAAKEGITLTRARNVLFVERWWTAAEEEQAEDRARRIGQLYPVKVWFLHVAGSVDDRIAEIVEKKRHAVRKAIGARTIEETEAGAVQSLLRAWAKGAGLSGPVGPSAPLLGHGAPRLSPLPSPRETCALLFRGSRWASPEGAIQWAKMNGYATARVDAIPGGWRVVNRPASMFEAGTFAKQVLSADIVAVTGFRR